MRKNKILVIFQLIIRVTISLEEISNVKIDQEVS